MNLQGRNEESLQYLQTAYEYAERYQNLAGQEKILRETAKVYEELKRYQEAYNSLLQVTIILEKVMEEKTKTSIARYEARLEMEKKLNEKEQLLLLYARQAEMGQMIAAIAHQWRQPLNVLSLILDSIYDAWEFKELDSRSLHDKVASGKEMIASMNTTINEFREFFRAEQLQDAFEIKDVIEQAVRFTDYRFSDHQIKLEYSIKDKCHLRGSSNQLLQVILIILNNAFDAFQDKEVQNPLVTISEKMEDGMSVICISDNAGGIPAEAMQHIFKANYSTKKNADGTGIGLYLAKMIIELKFKGSITAMNNDGGANFTIQIAEEKKF
jgi:C4-dicarboxylate-specific signal transduction histidine kinase